MKGLKTIVKKKEKERNRRKGEYKRRTKGREECHHLIARKLN